MGASLSNAVPASPPTPRRSPRWFKLLVVATLVLGIGFRFVNLSPKHKAVSWNEVRTALSLSGQDLPTARGKLLALQAATGQLRTDQIENAQIENAQIENAQIENTQIKNTQIKQLQRLPILGDRVTLWRFISALLSLLVWPAGFWMVRSLFPEAPALAPLTLSLMALSPLQLAVAQEFQATSLTFAVLLLAQVCINQGLRKKNWRYVGFAVLLLPLIMVGLALSPASALSLVGLLVELMLYVAIALLLVTGLGRGDRRRLALGGWGLLLGLAIALNGWQVMSFSGGLKGSANDQLPIAQQLRQQPAPLVADLSQPAAILPVLSLSHHLPPESLWQFKTSTEAGPDPEPWTQPVYLYRPSPPWLEQLQQRPGQLQSLAESVSDQLWLWQP